MISTNDNKHLQKESESEIDNIYKFKYLNSRNDSHFHDDLVNDSIGSYNGVLLNRKITSLDRFNESKRLIINADAYERSILNMKFDGFRKILQRRGINYGIKGFLGLVFINSIVNRNQKKDLILLNGSDKCACPKKVIFSFAAFAGSLVLL